MRTMFLLTLLLAAALPSMSEPPATRVVVYYLYFTPRCQTCLDIEAFSKEVVDSSFSTELGSGAVEWRSYDVGQPEYEHYWDDFKLELKSLVMAEMKGDSLLRWKVCGKTWDLYEDKAALQEYVHRELTDYLK